MVVASGIAWAQGTAQLDGRVNDESGGLLPGAVTVDGPKVLAKPWTSAPRRWTLGNGEVYEFYCTNNHELDELGQLKQYDSQGK